MNQKSLYKLRRRKRSEMDLKSNLEEEKVFSVGEFVDFLNSIITPHKVIVQGEISQVSSLPGFTFFKLLDKDEKAVLDCFVWQNRLDSIGVSLEEGLEVQVSGFPEIYKDKGRFNFRVENIGLVGEGVLKKAFETLKLKLAAAGFFTGERKRVISPYIERIGLITSTAADAKTDFLTHLGEFGFKIYFYDVRVEGFRAAGEIASAIRWFNQNSPEIEILALTRGGGSMESLQAFNSEEVAKAIFSSKIPIITGIGHENDETIADLIADHYASTPTDAARVLSDHWRQAEVLLNNNYENIDSRFALMCTSLQKLLDFSKLQLVIEMQNSLASEGKRLANLWGILNSSFEKLPAYAKSVEKIFLNNLMWLKTKASAREKTLSQVEKSLWYESSRWIKDVENRIANHERQLKLVDPGIRLKQGYSIVRNDAGKVVKAVEQIARGDILELEFHKGIASSRVERVKSKI